LFNVLIKPSTPQYLIKSFFALVLSFAPPPGIKKVFVPLLLILEQDQVPGDAPGTPTTATPLGLILMASGYVPMPEMKDIVKNSFLSAELQKRFYKLMDGRAKVLESHS
jgi:hypothetical protein